MLPMPARICSTTNNNTEGLHAFKLNQNCINVDIKNMILGVKNSVK
jgi:hypothetical protein